MQAHDKIKVPYLHHAVKPADLHYPGGKLYSEFNLNKVKALALPEGRTPLTVLSEKGVDGAAYELYKTQNKVYYKEQLPTKAEGLRPLRNSYVLSQQPPGLFFFDKIGSKTQLQFKPEHLQAQATLASEKKHAPSSPLSKTFNEEELKTLWEQMSAANPKAERYNYYALYKTLGSGSFGSVELAQDLNKGEFVAVKTMKVSRERPASSVKNMARREKNILRKTGQIMAAFLQADENREEVMVMELGGGHTIADRLNSNVPLSLAHRLDMAISTLEALGELHDLRILHRDLKPDNAIFRHGKVKLIDMGLAKEISPEEKALEVDFSPDGGTLTYMAPETINRGRSNEKTEVHAVGKMIMEVLNFARVEFTGLYAKISLEPLDSPLIQSKKQSPEDRIPTCIWHCLNNMTNDLPALRPTRQEALDCLKAIRQFLEPTALIATVGYLDVSEYLWADPKEQKKMLEHLSHMEEVCLLDEANNAPENRRDYLVLRQQLEKMGVQVRDEVVTYQSKQLMQALHSLIAADEEAHKVIYEGALISAKGVIPIQQFIDESQIRKIGDRLQEEMKNLNDTYGEKASEPMKTLNQFLDQLEHDFTEGELTFVKLHEALATLQARMTDLHSTQVILQTMINELETSVRQKLIATKSFPDRASLPKLEEALVSRGTQVSFLEERLKALGYDKILRAGDFKAILTKYESDKNNQNTVKAIIKGLDQGFEVMDKYKLSTPARLVFLFNNADKFADLKDDIAFLKENIESYNEDHEDEPSFKKMKLTKEIVALLMDFPGRNVTLAKVIPTLEAAKLCVPAVAANFVELCDQLKQIDSQYRYSYLENLVQGVSTLQALGVLDSGRWKKYCKVAADPESLRQWIEVIDADKEDSDAILSKFDSLLPQAPSPH